MKSKIYIIYIFIIIFILFSLGSSCSAESATATGTLPIPYAKITPPALPLGAGDNCTPIVLQSYDGSEDTTTNVYGDRWVAQTFTHDIDADLTNINLKISREGSPATGTINIYEVDGDSKPTGDPIATGTFNGNTLSAYPAYDELNVELDAIAETTGGTMYAYVIKALTGDGSNQLHPALDNTSPSYTEGQYLYSTDAGSNWTGYSTIDASFFEIWGCIDTATTTPMPVNSTYILGIGFGFFIFLGSLNLVRNG